MKLKSAGRGQFAIYKKLVEDAGLAGQAFYGHKATAKQQKMLEKLRKRSIYEAKEERKSIAKLLGKEEPAS